jgi:transposase InsO family protein
VARGRRRYRRTTQSGRDAAWAGNHLARGFTVRRPNRVWAGDITAIWTAEGWRYLAVWLDLAARRVVGWAAHDTRETALPLAPLRQARARRRVRPGLLHHSDRGTQYASGRSPALLARHGLRVSMSRKGNCWDNSVSESFFSTLTTELHPARWATRTDARDAIADDIDAFYNRRRLHSTLGDRSPVDFEARLKVAV